MTFEIKIKAGFFKTQNYYLTVEAGQIILTPREDSENRRLVIEDHNLKSVSIISRNTYSGELEITTHSNTYIGSINLQTGMEEITKKLAQEFGSKFIFQHGNI